MIWTIVRHEWTLMRREPMAFWAAALLLVASGYALYGGLSRQSTRIAETAATQTEAADQFEAQRASAQKSEAGGAVSAAKTFAALPPGPLAAFSVGLADLSPERAEISIWKRPDTLFGRYQLESPLSLLAGRFDLGFVVLYLLPLFVLALSYDLLAAERQRGTLPLVLMQPVSLARLTAAKVLARLILLTAFLVIVVTVGALAAGLSAAAWPRLLGWTAIAWLYGVFWLAMCALISAFARRPETCAAALASVWLAVVLVIPGLLNTGVQAAGSMPSRLEFVTEMRAATSDASRESAEILAEYYHEHPELATNGKQGGFIPAYYASQRQVEERTAPLLADFDQRLAKRQELVERWRFLSPTVLAQEALIELAGSGLERRRQANAQALALLEAWHETLSPKIFLGQGLEPADYDRLPTFAFVEPPVSVPRLSSAAVGLVVPSLIAVFVARRRLNRFDLAS